MKNINKNELIELIKSIPSRSYTEKPIIIFLDDYRGVDDIISQHWGHQYISMHYPFNDVDSIEREGSLFLGACLFHDDKDDLQWCLQWQSIHKKPVIVLMNKGEVSVKELDEEDQKNPYMIESDIMCAPKRKRDFSDLDKDMQYFIETNFEIYSYN